IIAVRAAGGAEQQHPTQSGSPGDRLHPCPPRDSAGSGRREDLPDSIRTRLARSGGIYQNPGARPGQRTCGRLPISTGLRETYPRFHVADGVARLTLQAEATVSGLPRAGLTSTRWFHVQYTCIRTIGLPPPRTRATVPVRRLRRSWAGSPSGSGTT